MAYIIIKVEYGYLFLMWGIVTGFSNPHSSYKYVRQGYLLDSLRETWVESD